MMFLNCWVQMPAFFSIWFKLDIWTAYTYSLHSMRADLTSNNDFCLLRIQHRLLNVQFSFASYSFIIKENIINVCIIRKLYHLIILISISVSNRLKSYINIDVYLSATIYHMSTFCISYIKVVILLQDSKTLLHS